MDTDMVNIPPAANVPPPAPQDLRDLVCQRLGVRWDQWAAAHPHLAKVIDRTRLVESAVTSLRNDPQFVAALRQADLDETQLAAAARAVELAEKWLIRFLPL
jgi:hypothetical protein